MQRWALRLAHRRELVNRDPLGSGEQKAMSRFGVPMVMARFGVQMVMDQGLLCIGGPTRVCLPRRRAWP